MKKLFMHEQQRKWVLPVLLGIAACLVVWRLGFYRSEPKSPAKKSTAPKNTASIHTAAAAETPKGPAENPAPPAAAPATDSATTPVAAESEQKPASVATASQPPAAKKDEPTPAQEPAKVVVEPNALNVASEVEEALNLRDVEMKLIIQKIADWTGKVVIPTDDIMKEKITIYAPGRLPRSEALAQVYGALRLKGYTAEFVDKTIYLKRMRDARVGTVPVIAPDQPLAAIENKDQIVQKAFKLAHATPGQMVQVIQPLIGDSGHISTDEPTSSLFVIDTVRNLMRIETMVAQFDVAGAQQLMTEVFEVRNRTPGEIVQLLQLLLGGSGRGPGGGGSFRTVLSVPDSPSGDYGGRGRGRFASSTVVSGARGSMILIAEPKFNWIIAKASTEDMQEIRSWIEKLDQPVPTVVGDDSLDKIENKNQVVQRFLKLKNTTPDRMSSILAPLLGPTGRVLPESNTNTLMVIDTVENLLRIEKVVTQFDVPPREDIVTQVFELQHREPEEITTLLSSILGEGVGSSMNTFGQGSYRGPNWATRIIRVDRARFKSSRPTAGPGGDQPVVFIPEPRRKWIIVKARPEDMESITTWIKKLDQPMPTIAAGDSLDKIENKTQIVQRFFKLQHCSADRMSEILMPMLGTSGRILPEQNTNTLLMIDTVENLLRAEEIIDQFDVAPQENVVTQVFELQYREPDEIASLLSAVLGDNTGASTNVYGRDRSTSNWSVRAIRVDRSKFRTNNRPWTPNAINEQSALFIPEPRRKWIIVKARPEDLPSITDWIQKLDKPMLTVTADDTLDKIENKKDVVQRFIKLKHASVDRMTAIITPMLGDMARVTPEPTTGTLMVVDSVENLLRIEKIVAQFDVAQRDDTVTQVFELQHREPEEIANLLGAVVGDNSLSTASTSQIGQYRQNWDWAGRAMRLSRFRSGAPNRAQSNPIAAGSSEQPMLFIPEPHRKWIIVKARPEDMELIEGWIKRLDKPMPTITAEQSLAEIQTKNQVVQRFIKLEHYDPLRMSDIVTPLLTESGHVTAEEGTATLLIIDTVENLLRIEAIIAQFDVAEAGTATEIFEVRQRSPEEIIGLLETVLTDTESAGGGTSYGGRSGPASRPRRPGGPRSRFTGATNGGASTTIMAPGGRAIILVPEAKQGWIIAKAASADMAAIRQWIQRLDRPVATITSDTPLSTIENKNQVIQRCIKLRSYSASQMSEIVLPLLSESGYISADESTGNLLVIDTVENLTRIEAIIAQFDVPGAEKTTTQVFEMGHADPAEVVQLLRMLLSDTPGRPGGGYGGYGRSYPGSRGYPSGGSRLYRGGYSGSAATSVIMGPSQLPVVLIPEPKRKWIIARASAEDMKLISEWIQKLDRGEPTGKEYETVPITYADVREVATRINEALQQMPGTELQASVLVQALEQARQVMVFGRADLREMVRKMIEEIDVPPGQFETRHFELKHADPDQIKRSIDELFGEGAMTSRTASYRSYGGYGSRSGAGLSPDTVKTIAHVTLKQVTVIASPENMKKIAEQIAQWDVAVDVNAVRPRIFELHNSDPAQMATLLKTLFSQEMSSRYSFFDYLFGSSSQDKQRIVGPLYGQLTFEQVPGAKKLVVISNIPQAYGVVEDLVKELDGREAAEVPKVVRLNYADPEVLAQRLNAMFNETGTSAAISLTQRGLSEYSMDDSSSSSGGNSNARNAPSNSIGNQGPAAEYRPWWTTGGRTGANQVPISNIIGRARFIPDAHSKSVLVLAPPEFMESLQAMITELDIPGRQLMLKAIVMLVNHQNMTSLGLQYSSDPTRWNPPDNENALVARNTFSALQHSGTLVIDPKTGAATGHGLVVQEGINLSILIDFLMRDLHAKILNQQTLWTKDNEEAQFFKGQRVGFQTQISISDTGGRATSNFEYEKVGMTLRARPSITPEKNVDMIINIILSQLESELINTQPVRTELDTTTNLVVKDGQTIMLGGMLFQEDSQTNRKVPFLGDLPLLGALFRHKQDIQANSELLIFITPYVVETSEQMLPEARQEQETARQKLHNLQEELRPLAEQDSVLPADGDAPDAAPKTPAPDTEPAADDRTKETK
jgi:type II secretory pathway component GspD/PulD (secretin)